MDSLLDLGGYPIIPIDLATNLQDGVKFKVEMQRTVKRHPGNLLTLYSHGVRQSVTTPLYFWGKGRGGIYSLLEFVHGRKGRLYPFWVALPIYTLLPHGNFGSALSIIQIKKTGWAVNLRGDERIYVHLTTGERITRKALSIAGGTDFDTITLNSAITPIVTPADIVELSFLLFVRFDVDEFEFDFAHAGFCELHAPVVELPYEHPS